LLTALIFSIHWLTPDDLRSLASIAQMAPILPSIDAEVGRESLVEVASIMS
jgi:hypothetical protein